MLLRVGIIVMHAENYIGQTQQSLFNHPAGDDYTLSGGTSQVITFGNLEMAKEINVTSLHDDIGEGDKVIILDLKNDETNFIDVNIGQNTTQITILEDDGK